MPDLNGIEVYKQVKPHLDSKRAKVVGMVLHTAQSEISAARQAGMREFLYKPFTKTDVTSLFAGLGVDAGDGTRKWFTLEGNVRVLAFPEEGDPLFKSFANALGTDIRQELNNIADEGGNKLIIRLTPGVVADFAIVKKFLSLLELIQELTLTVRLVADNDKTREKLKQFSETARIETFKSMDQALETLA
jgi:CheY-like chemotaxis protein